jgi:inner membrane protein
VDVFTHALLGATLARASAAERASNLTMRERMMVGGLAGAFPDIDFAAFAIDPLRFLADWHQGPTHSLVLLPLWAALLGAVVARLASRRRVFAPAAFVAGLGIASHIASDAITAYGTAVFFPLSTLRVGFSTVFVIDPLFTLIVLAGLIAATAPGRRSFAVAGLLALCLYVSGLAFLQQRALDVARAYATAAGLSFEHVDALAQPFSPFNWKLIGVEGDRYHEAHVNLAGHSVALPLPARLAKIAGAYRAPAQLAWRVRHRYGDREDLRGLVEQRWQDPAFAPYRRFAAYPAVSRIDGNGNCVWFTDLRYDLPMLPDTFRYGFCRDDSVQGWALFRLRYFSEHARQRVPSSR